MKKLYWRPQRISQRVMLFLAILSGTGLLAVETFTVKQKQAHYAEKLRAARLCRRAFRRIREERLQRGILIDNRTDPTGSGLIGVLLSPNTTNQGHLPAKQTTINPNFAALVVELLHKADVKSGATVAVGLSGSFPAINIAVLCALRTLNLKALVIASAGASQWGANHPRLTWPDMETVLNESGIIPYKSIAASYGGVEDQAIGLSTRGKRAIEEAIARNKVEHIRHTGFKDSLEKRMALYKASAGSAEVQAYINVGGGTVSVGTHVGKHQFRPGLNRSGPRGPAEDSVMYRFAARGLPVIHMSSIDKLATRYGLPLQPQTMPAAGQGAIFVRESYSRWLAAAVLAALLGLLVAFLRLDWGHRLFASGAQKTAEDTNKPEPMV